MTLRLLLSAMAGVLVTVQPVSAQNRVISVTVRGVAYDSLRRAPLRDAFVSLVGGGRTTTTDSKGRFRFDSVTPGAYTFTMLHAALDSLGFTGFATRAQVTDGRTEVRIATPSFLTLWRAACGTVRKQEDSAFVYGTVRNAATNTPVADAVIDVGWTDFVATKRRLWQRQWGGQTRSDSKGDYTLCGVPDDVSLRVHAEHDSAASGFVDLPPVKSRVYRRDLVISTQRDSSRFGTVAGFLTDVAGGPFVDVRVAIDGVPEVRSGADGRFILRSVPPGTRQVTFLFVGMDPMSTVVDVAERDTARADMHLGKVTRLPGMRTTGAAGNRVLAAEFTERRRAGFGHSVDSIYVAKHREFVNVLREIPGLHVQYRSGALALGMPDGRGGECIPEIRIDGAEAAPGHLVGLFPKEVAGMEVYVRTNTIPVKFAASGIGPLCGMILVWTKYGFSNR